MQIWHAQYWMYLIGNMVQTQYIILVTTYFFLIQTTFLLYRKYMLFIQNHFTTVFILLIPFKLSIQNNTKNWTWNTCKDPFLLVARQQVKGFNRSYKVHVTSIQWLSLVMIREQAHYMPGIQYLVKWHTCYVTLKINTALQTVSIIINLL